MKVAVLTTSYPRNPGDAAGRFIADAVERVRARGVEVEVVSPISFEHHGIAYGSGVIGNLRQRPVLALYLPSMQRNFRRAARAAARDADLIHAHWLPSGGVAMSLGKPYVVQVWGTDLELARRLPLLAKPILRRAQLVIAASNALAEDAARLGAREVHVIPTGVDVPEQVGEPAEPPEVLFAGRLSREKGILDLVAAAEGLPLVVAGDGPLREQVPMALGMVPHPELLVMYDRAAVVACPSYREGFGVVCAEAMAHGRPVVAGAVGGLLDLVVDDETGLLVEPGDVAGLRAALERLLGDPELRRRLGEAGCERIRRHFSWPLVTDATLAAYSAALR
ncbi:MAG TPA: glycosyltransferase family 4 protein [Gaiellaceae bacterium]|nr:glycosyltransferase family 4 protein [Gaiellaceae bacterium]